MSFRALWSVLAVAAALAIGVLAEEGEEADAGAEEGTADGGEEEGDEAPDEGVIVHTPLGPVKGAEFDNIMNGSFFAFFGIPYAKPPLGPLRFMPPVPAEPWVEVLEASEEAVNCMSYIVSKQMVGGTEDCLKVDVYTPKHPEELKKAPLPVLVHIHGGAFHFGGTLMEEEGPDYLLSQDIVLVQMRYRLSIFGFLSFQDNVLPGNAGLKDQTMALKWVRDNIASFGGNPGKVTIFGVSAGGVSTHLHMVSPISRGLFHGVISASGNAISPWAFSRHPLLAATIMTDVYNCSRGPTPVLLHCLQAVDAEDLTVAQYNAILIEKKYFEGIVFTPCVEPKHPDAFLPDDPFAMLARGESADVPFLTGITENETNVLDALLSLSLIPEKFRMKVVSQLGDHVEDNIPKFEPFMGTPRMGAAAKYFYYRNESASFKNLPSMAQLSADIGFLMPAWDSVTLHLRHKKSPVFHYMFTHETNFSVVKHTLFFASPQGVGHGDFVNSYIMNLQANPVDEEHPGFRTAVKGVKIFSNFATFGNPTPDDGLRVRWLPSELANRYFLNFGEVLRLEKNMNFKSVDFWNEQRKREGLVV